ncbi:MAG: transglycosylase SLT domain-containing protein [Bacteroidaceae bacterium]
MNKKLLVIPAMLLSFSVTFAQQPAALPKTTEENKDLVTPIDSIELPQSMTADIDSILNEWHTKQFVKIDSSYEAFDESASFTDKEYIERLQAMPTIMEMTYNPTVRKMIDFYTKSNRKKVAFMLGAANFYMPIFEEALDACGLPLELKYLPIIESALDPTAQSRAGAVGLWQFMLTSGKQMGLECNSLIDDRRDPIKSSWAAAHYLKDLYRIFGDWNLVIAAYNCGPNNVNKAIHRAGGVKDYWTIYNYLPRETRGYVPAFIAANYVMNYYCEHGITPMKADISLTTDTIEVTNRICFKQIEGITNVPIEEIRALNPQYKADLIPGGNRYTLRLPIDKLNAFIDLGDSAYQYMADIYLTNHKTVEVPEETIAEVTNTTTVTAPSQTKTRTRRRPIKRHTIRKGDTLLSIASRYGVTVKQLQKMNGIKGHSIRAGKSIKIGK